MGIQLEREVLGDVDVPREAGEYVKKYLVQSTVCYAHTGYKERSIALYMSKKTDQALILGHRVKEKSVSMVIQDSLLYMSKQTDQACDSWPQTPDLSVPLCRIVW